jgi:flavin reductase (DIM6/NTAB) family NADH-FMN oxidoreductase RutF
LSQLPAEYLRHAMRQWTTGVTVVTSQMGDLRHGMTVNSFTSLSLEPPLVSVTLAIGTRTQRLVDRSGHFGVTILHEDQVDVSERFAGRIPEKTDRFEGLETFELVSGAPFIQGGLAFLDCKVIHTYTMPASKLYIGEVLAAQTARDGQPLIYHNRLYHRLER